MRLHVYIWESVSDLTDNEHNGGGLVVVAESLERAREICEANVEVKQFPSEEPDCVLLVPDTSSERIYVFPNAGCC
jgi:hypothetical protein